MTTPELAVIENHSFIKDAFDDMPTEDLAKVFALAQHIRVKIIDQNDLINILEHPHHSNFTKFNLGVSSYET